MLPACSLISLHQERNMILLPELNIAKRSCNQRRTVLTSCPPQLLCSAHELSKESSCQRICHEANLQDFVTYSVCALSTPQLALILHGVHPKSSTQRRAEKACEIFLVSHETSVSGKSRGAVPTAGPYCAVQYPERARGCEVCDLGSRGRTCSGTSTCRVPDRRTWHAPAS